MLFQVKLRPDPAKTGFSAEEFRQAWPLLRDLAPLRPVGLMTIAPRDLTEEERRRLFQECADLAAEHGLEQLSMGMSGDWPEAVAAGSTWVRLGTTLFGVRPGAGSPLGPEAPTNTF